MIGLLRLLVILTGDWYYIQRMLRILIIFNGSRCKVWNISWENR